ncbi:MAG: hypothetical protein HC902_14410 [Calothrix sp. SM1_5_4]|nr:hypothetical protein [Calothrix sp. SM1_5_4]
MPAAARVDRYRFERYPPFCRATDEIRPRPRLEDQRASVRLGKDAFSAGYIRPITQAELERALLHFRSVCERLKVDRIQAVGTSALRDSSNSKKIISELKNRTGIEVRLINGRREAALLHKAVSHVLDISHRSALLIDMGGGSLEVVLSRHGRLVTKQSLPLGTVRLCAKPETSPATKISPNGCARRFTGCACNCSATNNIRLI